jgi:hypothetical protein
VKLTVAIIPLGPFILHEILASPETVEQDCRVLATSTLNYVGNVMSTVSPLISLVAGPIVKRYEVSDPTILLEG